MQYPNSTLSPVSLSYLDMMHAAWQRLSVTSIAHAPKDRLERKGQHRIICPPTVGTCLRTRAETEGTEYRKIETNSTPCQPVVFFHCGQLLLLQSLPHLGSVLVDARCERFDIELTLLQRTHTTTYPVDRRNEANNQRSHTERSRRDKWLRY